MANGVGGGTKPVLFWISLSNTESPDRPLGDFRASAVRALEGRSYSSLVESTGARELPILFPSSRA
jgi:hypothetical protein